VTLPCPRCGETRTDPVRHGTMYKLVWAFGYRLHQCSRCRAARFIPRHRGISRGSSQGGKELASAPWFAEERRGIGTAEARSEPKEDQVTAADSSDRGLRPCPACGSTEYHRSKRTKLERLQSRPPMARCETCGMRFPYPRDHDEPSDSVKAGELAATVSHIGEEGMASRTVEESSLPKVDKQETAADYSNRGLGCCPACGSAAYRRSRRTSLERLLLRPRMARCQHCRKRFPYPKR
jgi:ssDNA-binding Zn-finger/Zn-ribbon topoisomerase 1